MLAINLQGAPSWTGRKQRARSARMRPGVRPKHRGAGPRGKKAGVEGSAGGGCSHGPVGHNKRPLGMLDHELDAAEQATPDVERSPACGPARHLSWLCVPPSHRPSKNTERGAGSPFASQGCACAPTEGGWCCRPATADRPEAGALTLKVVWQVVEPAMGALGIVP